MDDMDRRIITLLQEGVPVCDRPWLAASEQLGITEADLLERLQRLLASGHLSRVGPMYHAERMGGALSLCAMAVPEARFDEVAALVNAHVEVAHNYARDHALNMWFVLATEAPEQVAQVLAAITAETGIPVHDMPKLEEYFIGLRFAA